MELARPANRLMGLLERSHGLRPGKIAILGIAATGFEIDWNKVIFKMLTLKGIYGREMFETWYKMIALVQGPPNVSGLITHRIGIDDYQSGFEAMRNGQAAKVVMDW